ncbi:MAG: type IV pili methyl-accepting chemotaxis transducer N-terminal domain-containing protein [Alphaproteobacteria bacterium]|uniref:Type IV pili methyl-accepting chemotaxis transducer N-terminal domain-containing protein n=1 Tax=Candidatus Nitrobium versatile TaxID=2884831 RepID=A0A953J6B7_9BACT|nr:type IV pili methyl-accepting chemotaxis transducer N-terminal domain-containing protein [Candidatus Nitrobium versatile]
MKILTQLRIGIGIFLFFSLLSAASVYFQLNRMEHDGMIVDYAGEQQTLSQRIAAHVSLKYQGIRAEKEMNEAISRLETIIKGLINGDRALHPPRATDKEFLLKMREIEAIWVQYKATIGKALEGENVLNGIRSDSRLFLNAAEESVLLAAKKMERNVRTLKLIQSAILVSNLLLLATLLLTSQKKIAQPLSGLTNDVDRISTGDLTVEVAYSGRDEIGILARDMRKMVRSLSNELREPTSGFTITE